MSAEGTAAWRFGVFRALGFGVDQAMRLADSAADWHRVESALEHGCTHDQAARIFI